MPPAAPHPSNHDVCVIVPAYNEASVLGPVVQELARVFPRVVCVDDGSKDTTSLVARSAGATVIRHGINLGQGAALQTGFDYALSQADVSYVITFDGDGQHHTRDALSMVAMARSEKLDVVLGSRNLGATVDQPLRRKVLLRGALALSRRMTRLKLSDTHNGLRVLSRKAISHVRLTHAGMAYASELEIQIARQRLSWAECPTSITYSDYSKSKGQANLNAVNILFDLATARLRGAA